MCSAEVGTAAAADPFTYQNSVDLTTATTSGQFRSGTFDFELAGKILQGAKVGEAPSLASAQRDRKHSLALFRQAVRTIVDDAPAVFLYSPTNPYSVSSRIRGIELNPIAPFSALWRWNPGPFR